jgi:hypothetical protein
MKVKIVNVDVEKIVDGKKNYSKAVVTYLYEGQARTQNLVSFTNPAVFKAVQEKVGQEVDVTITKNAGGYNQWAALGDVGSTSTGSTSTPQNQTAPSTTSSTTRVTGSNYETKEERAARQVYIVKQSSISAAVALSEANKAKSTPEEIIAVAQKFVDFVFEQDNSIEAMPSDIL